MRSTAALLTILLVGCAQSPAASSETASASASSAT